MQKRLNEAGITDEEGKPLLEDGIYGEKTKKAHEKAIKIKQFEDENSGVMYGGKSGEKSINEVPDGPGEYEHKVPTTEEMTSYMDNAVLLPIAQEILKNPGSKELQRAFWKTASPLVLKNDPLSLKMLLHSLQDNPSPFTEANFPQIGSLVCSDNNFREEIKEVVANNTSGQLTDYPIDTFNFENGDLSKSIHGVDKITVNGDKNTDGTWDLAVTVTDTYDYTTYKALVEFVGAGFDALYNSFTSGSKEVNPLKKHILPPLKATFPLLANNLAYLSQKSGAIHDYRVNFMFKCKLTNGELVATKSTE